MEERRTTVLQPHLQAHLSQRQALHITPVRFRRNEVALIREQKAFIENTIAVYRMAFPTTSVSTYPLCGKANMIPGKSNCINNLTLKQYNYAMHTMQF